MRCVMRYAWTPKFQLSGPTVHSYTVVGRTSLSQSLLINFEYIQIYSRKKQVIQANMKACHSFKYVCLKSILIVRAREQVPYD